jgi:signal transduction histidine kinase
MTATAWVHEIAHDINNEIGTIRRQAYFLGQQIGTPPSARCYIDQIDASAGRLAEYARAPKLDNARLICLNYWLQNYVTQIVDHSRRSADISYRFDFSACSPQVYVPEVLLERAVRHLVRNALEAMGTTGRLTVRTLCNERDVEVRIANTGPDIPKDVRQKLFFGQVTTKNKERQVDGGGLGLLFVRWAVEAMKGKVYLLSAPGDEVTFSFKLPLAEVVEEKGLLV